MASYFSWKYFLEFLFYQCPVPSNDHVQHLCAAAFAVFNILCHIVKIGVLKGFFFYFFNNIVSLWFECWFFLISAVIDFNSYLLLLRWEIFDDWQKCVPNLGLISGKISFAAFLRRPIWFIAKSPSFQFPKVLTSPGLVLDNTGAGAWVQFFFGGFS